MDNISLIQSYLKKEKLTITALVEKMGIGRNTFYYQIRKENPDTEFVENFNKVTGGDIHSIININTHALKFSSNARTIGDISYPIDLNETPFVPIGEGQYVMIVPLVNEFAHAGYLAGYKDPEFIDELPKHSIIVNKQGRGIYQAFEVIGESMEDWTSEQSAKDSIQSGSIATGRQIKRELWQGKFHTHRWDYWVFIHKEGILIKKIGNHDTKNGIVTLVSQNPDKNKYPDKEIHLDDVSQVYNVIQITKPL